MRFLIKWQTFSCERDELLWLMTSEDTVILETLANYIFTCFNARKHSCSSSQQI